MFKLLIVAFCASAALASPTLLNCGQTCKTDAECTQGDCTQCIFGKCGTGCSFPCKQSSECRDPNCEYCAVQPGHTSKSCWSSPESGCGGSCKMNSDCNQDPKNACKICIDGTCTANCGQPCKDDGECGASKGSTCKKCVVGICQADNKKCGATCTVNNDCEQGGDCFSCILGTCGAGCADSCTADSQCLDKNCPKCNTTKKCARSGGGDKCHDPCLTNADCAGQKNGRCDHCIFGKCGAACGNYCDADKDCVTTGCTLCKSNKCDYNK